MEKNKPNTTKARIHQSKQMYYNTKTKESQVKSPLTTSGLEIERAYSYFGSS